MTVNVVPISRKSRDGDGVVEVGGWGSEMEGGRWGDRRWEYGRWVIGVVHILNSVIKILTRVLGHVW